NRSSLLAGPAFSLLFCKLTPMLAKVGELPKARVIERKQVLYGHCLKRIDRHRGSSVRHGTHTLIAPFRIVTVLSALAIVAPFRWLRLGPRRCRQRWRGSLLRRYRFTDSNRPGPHHASPAQRHHAAQCAPLTTPRWPSLSSVIAIS